uniref:ZMYM2-like/QRICH1 C-terminal domain-containing protein n=1 Tax=Amphimedon queenslandica TaxID=400682 RepID=A0A1X7VA36_AMPQE
MLEVIQETNTDLYLLYTEWGSKNRTGRLSDRKVTNKSVKILRNIENPERCVVRLYQKYLSLRPSGAPPDVFYFKPLNVPLSNCWYSCRPVGHNLLSQTVKRLCSNIGIEGHNTNHSLRRTCVTRLFQKGIGEQQIMSVTGHRSTDAVRVYKSMSHDQEEAMSKIIQNRVEESQQKTEQNKENEGQMAKVPNMFNFSNCNVVFRN